MFGLVGVLFNLVTFPGIVVNHVAESVFAGVVGAPTYSVRLRDDVSREEFAAACEEVGLDAEHVDELDAEALSNLSNRKLAVLNRVVEVNPDEEFEDGETLIHYAGMDAFSKVFLVALLPFVVSSALCFGILLVGLPVGSIAAGILNTELVWWAAIWLGVSVGAHVFPNAKATDALWAKSSEAGLVLKLVGYPYAAIAKFANLLRFLWLDALYALVIYYVVEFLVFRELLGITSVPF